MTQLLRLAEEDDDVDDNGSGKSINRVVLDEYNNTIILYDYISEAIAAEITEKYPRLAVSADAVSFKINSYGGSLYAVQSILTDMMELKRAKKEIIVSVNGVAMSGAAMIALAGTYIKMSRFGWLMLHYPSWGTSDERNIQEHKVDLDVTKENFELIMKELLKDKKLTFAKFQKLTDNKNLYLTPTECVKYGLVDEII